MHALYNCTGRSRGNSVQSFIFKSVSYTYVRVSGHDMTCLLLLGALRVSSVVFYGFLCPFSCV